MKDIFPDIHLRCRVRKVRAFAQECSQNALRALNVVLPRGELELGGNRHVLFVGIRPKNDEMIGVKTREDGKETKPKKA
jgi:hypothetical protein